MLVSLFVNTLLLLAVLPAQLYKFSAVPPTDLTHWMVVSSAVTGETTYSAKSLVNKPQPGKQPAVTKAGVWSYEKTADKSGGTVYKASVIANKLLQFDYPYAGGSTATLVIRKRDDNTHVFIEVSKGQFNRSFQGGSARIRFDGKPPITYSLSAAANGRANIVFFDSEQRLINQIKAARQMSVQVQFYGQGVRTIEFTVTGLAWS